MARADKLMYVYGQMGKMDRTDITPCPKRTDRSPTLYISVIPVGLVLPASRASVLLRECLSNLIGVAIIEA